MKKTLNRLKLNLSRGLDYFFNSIPKEGNEVINIIGHRSYVGGHWDELGRLQFNFLKKMELKQSHCLLDIGCGSLRGGVHFIQYLDKKKYIGLDKEKMLIDLGLKKELRENVISKKQPNFIYNDKFNFSELNQKPDFSIAQSVFSHLNYADINLCLTSLRAVVDKDHQFFATFKEGNSLFNREKSNSFSVFYYSFKTLSDLAFNSGWNATFIGEFGHPRKQLMVKFSPS